MNNTRTINPAKKTVDELSDASDDSSVPVALDGLSGTSGDSSFASGVGEVGRSRFRVDPGPKLAGPIVSGEIVDDSEARLKVVKR
jgi:hypothetical protein